MSKLRNPFLGLPGYDCFGCAPGNPWGLRMEFHEEGEEVVCRWTPREHFQGWSGVLHGGVQAALMDELASWAVFVRLRTAGVTSRLETVYRQPVYVGRGGLTLRARVSGVEGREAAIQVSLLDGSGRLCSEAVATYHLFPPETARRRLHYPGHESFHAEEGPR